MGFLVPYNLMHNLKEVVSCTIQFIKSAEYCKEEMNKNQDMCSTGKENIHHEPKFMRKKFLKISRKRVSKG